jgi:hypothetical protein
MESLEKDNISTCDRETTRVVSINRRRVRGQLHGPRGELKNRDKNEASSTIPTPKTCLLKRSGLVRYPRKI